MRVLDLFSGIGGFSLGLERARMRAVAFCEIDPFCRRVLAKHWPDVPCYDDVRTLTVARLASDGIAVDAICGGFPCQNVSPAASAHGGNTGLDGSQSGLWFEYARLIGELKPQIVVIENVYSLARNGLDRVLGSLAALGYDAQWDVIPGWLVGAPQARERIWIIAYPAGERIPGLFASIRACASRQGWPGGTPHLFDVAAAPFGGDDRFPQPLLRGSDDRPAHWMDRIAGCGNAVVPQIPELIGRAIMTAHAKSSQSPPLQVGELAGELERGRG